MRLDDGMPSLDYFQDSFGFHDRATPGVNRCSVRKGLIYVDCRDGAGYFGQGAKTRKDLFSDFKKKFLLSLDYAGLNPVELGFMLDETVGRVPVSI